VNEEKKMLINGEYQMKISKHLLIVLTLFVTSTNVLAAYCSASGGCDEYIYQVQVGSINNNATACNNYKDYTSTHSTTMQPGTGYTINVVTATIVNGTITPYSGYEGDQLGIWVDWNGDEDFSDTGETVYTVSDYGYFTTTITPPIGTPGGNKRMRVRLTYTGTISPCGTTSYGEVEDYKIIIPSQNIKISGYAKTAEGVKIKGINVSASTGQTTSTDALGYYELIVNSPYNGTITPSQLNWTFSPTSRTYSNVTTNQVNQDYTCTYSASYGGGTGEPNDPYQIWTAEQMDTIGADANDWNKCFILMTDIDLGYYDGLNGRPNFNCIGKGSPYGHTGFTGSFDGNGKTIRNFTYSTYKSYNVGIFAYLDGPTGKIQDLIIESPLVNYIGGGYCGALVGRAEGGIIRNCHVIGGSILWGDYAGALVGDNWADVYNCSAATTVTGIEHVGGLVGRNQGRIYESFTSGPVYGTTLVGGIAGRNSDAFSSHGIIENSYSTSNVTGKWAGGLVGQQWGGSVVNSYSTGKVSGSSNIGGLIGEIIAGGYVSNSFWDTSTSLIGISAGGTGLPTEQMQDIDTFLNAGWDLMYETANGTEDIWFINPNSYPQLSWEGGSLKYGGGTGDPNDPYQIWTPQQLNAIGVDANDWNKCFILMADIDMSDYTGTLYNIIGNYAKQFTGKFDGNGHEIFNLTYNSAARDCVGLFGHTGSGSEIKNLGLENVNVTGNRYIGGLIGLNRGLVTNCHSIGKVYAYADKAGPAGGLIGTSLGPVSYCYSAGTVYRGANVGGLIGVNNAIVTYCYSKASVEATGAYCAGGLIGYNSHGNVSSCYATGLVNASGSQSISSAGLIGINEDAVISNCYSIGVVTGSGSTSYGLIDNYRGDVIGCFWDIQASGQNSSLGGRGLTTEQMKTMSIYQNAGWADNGWVMQDGIDYPHLEWEQTGGALISPSPPIPLIGSGKQADPYQIWTAQDFALLSSYTSILDKHIILLSDLDLSGIDIYPIGDLGRFKGTFNGDGYVIRNAVINEPNSKSIGIFSYLGAGGELKNLAIEDANIIGKIYVGGLIGANFGTVSNCCLTGRISGTDYIGGLVGFNYSGVVRTSSSTSMVSGTNYVGGLIGCNSDLGIVTNSYSAGTASGTSRVGGVAGSNEDTITSCYSTCSVNGNQYIGGFVGDSSGSITSCFWDMDTSGKTTGIGSGSSDGIYGRTTTQMKQHATFTEYPYAWDFVSETANGTNDYWRMCIDGVSYPKLKFEFAQTDYICPDGVDFSDYAMFAAQWLQTDYGDANGLELTDDGIVNFDEFAIMASLWKVVGCGSCNGADYNNDGDIDEDDLKVLGQNWLRTDYGDVGGIDITGDGKVDYEELNIFAEEWLK
jgi:uncharacterized membrane protein